MRPSCFLACIFIHCSEISPWVKDVANWWTLLASASKWYPVRGAQAMHFCTKVPWPSGVGLGFYLATYDSGTPLTPNIVDNIFSNPVIHLFHFWSSFNFLGDASLLTELSYFASCLRMVDLCAATPKAALKDAPSRSSMLGVSLTLAKSCTQCIIDLRRLFFCRPNISLPSAAVCFEYEYSISKIYFSVSYNISSSCSMLIWSASLLAIVLKPIHVSVWSMLSISSSSSSLILNLDFLASLSFVCADNSATWCYFW